MTQGEMKWVPPSGNSSQFGYQFGQSRPANITAASEANDDGEIKPNHGATVPDQQAIGSEGESQASWQQRQGISRDAQIQLLKLAHMRYQHPDLPTITRFLRDFGMQIAKATDDEIWFRGYGPDNYVYYARRGEKKFLGGAFEVASRADLEKAAQLPNAEGPIVDMTDAPGGGSILTLRDPEGFPINLIYGQSPAPPPPPSELPEKVVYNDESHKPRVRAFNRFTPGPAAVHKLGHFGLCVRDFPAQVEWYTRTFNIVPTDFLYVPDGAEGEGGSKTKDVAVFAHIDRGETPVDHHTFFLSMNATSHVHHASFEVHDFDTQNLGHQWLGKQGYTSVWGIGRHILGSQIFDYWWDTTGNMIEHYADGDLVNDQTPIGRNMAGHESLAVWGPEVPKWFLE